MSWRLDSVPWDDIDPWAHKRDPAELVRNCSACGEDFIPGDALNPCVCEVAA